MNEGAHLILIMGLPGSGKTYFAKALAEHLGVAHFNSDRIRKENKANPDYSESDKGQVYQEMFTRTTDALQAGETVIVDATFSKTDYRKPYLDWAQEHDTPVHIIFLTADEEVIKERVSKKRPDSDADYAVYQKIKAEYEPIAHDHLVLQSDEGTTEERIISAIEHMNADGMNRQQIDELASAGILPYGAITQETVETHISFVILCEEKVYKIKKPVKLSFLDFSTLDKRKHFVEEELKLNQRLCPEVYLRSLPVRSHKGQLRIGGDEGKIVDYALEMMRLDNELEMDRMLKKGLVGKGDIDRILDVLIPFHQEALIVKGLVNAAEIKADFADLDQVTEFCRSHFGDEDAGKLTGSIAFAARYLENHQELIAQRDREGFVRDVHGDLHAGNIFLTERPILFDCIEFNPHFRRIDLINELAFFTMELDFAGYPELGDHLIEAYNRTFPVIRTVQEKSLFLFYKLYRANVKMKVNAIRAQQADDGQEKADREALFKDYFRLYLSYLEALGSLEERASAAS